MSNPSTLEFTADGTGVTTVVNGLKKDMASMAVAAKQAGEGLAAAGKASDAAFDGVGKKVDATARQTNAWAAQIKNSIIDIKTAGDAAANYEMKAVGKGIPADVYAPYVAQLRAVKAEQLAAAEGAATEAQALKLAAASAAEAASRLETFQRATQSARIELLSLGKIASEKLQIRAEVLGLDKSAVASSIAGLKAAETQAMASSAAAATEAQALKSASSAAAEAAAQIAAFQRATQNARIELLSLGKVASEKLQIRADILGLDKNSVAPLIAGLKATEAQAAATAAVLAGNTVPQLNAMGMSAKATANAMRMVPAQFTDIVVSLQSGQAPLTVMLQQGGQLKDMFGGVGNAAKAMGTYVLGLVNPFTVAVAAAAALAYAYSKGADEAHAYSKALVLTGNAVGTTSAQLAGMAQAVSKTTGGTIGAAAAVLAELAASGNIAVAQFEKISAVAIAMEKATGVATAETVKQFAELGKDPVSASEKLNESTHFLTISVYEQIKALAEQGRTVDAGTLAQNVFADVMVKRAPKMLENLGWLEKAWKSLSSTIREAGDGLKGIGRDVTNDDKIRTLMARRSDINAKLADPKLMQEFGGAERLNGILATVNAQLVGADAIAAASAKTAASDKASADITSRKIAWDKAGVEYATKQDKLTKEMTAAAITGQQQLIDGTITQIELEKRFANIREKYKDPAGPKEKVGDQFAAQREAAKEWEKFYLMSVSDASTAEAAVLDLTKAQKDLVDFTKSTGYTGMSTEAKLMVIDNMNNAIASEAITKATKEAAKSHDEYITSLEGSADAIAKKLVKMNDEVQAYGVSVNLNISLAEAIDLVALARLEEERAKQMSYGDDAAVAAIDKEIAARKELAGVIRQHDQHKAVVDAAKTTKDEWKKTADSINQTLTDALMRAFEGGATFAQAMGSTIVNMFKTMVLRPIINAVMTPVSMAVSGALGVSGSAAAGQGGSAMSGLSTVQALKGVYDTFTGGLAATYTNAAASSYGSALGLSTAPTGALSGATAGELAYTNAIASGATQSAANTAALQANTASLTSSGATLGTAVGIAAGAAAGLAIGTAISGEYGSGGTVIAGTAIGAAIGSVVPVIGTAIGAALGGAIGGLVNRAFGMGNTEVQSSGMRGTFSQSGFAGSNYANMHQSGGWFRGDKNWQETSALASGVADTMSKAFTGTKTAVSHVATSLGLAVDGIVSYSKAIDLAAGTTAEQMTAMFVGMADEMAVAVAPDIASFAKAGETASTTLSRLSTSVVTANAWLSLLRMRLLNVSLSGADAASKLADAFGGMDNLTASSKAFYETYYTEGERAARSQEDMAKALALVNLALPTSKDALRKMAQSLDLNTLYGRQAYAVLLSIAPEFAIAATAIEKIAGETATALLKTFSGNGQLVPALNAAALSVGDFTGSATAMSGELHYINSIMGDSTSAVIGFGNGAYILGTSMSASQLSAGLLNDQVVALKDSADKARIDFVGLGEALVNVNTETFVATIGLVFENLATRIQGVIGDINAERIAVRDAALQIISPTVMGKAQIQSGIAGINTNLPSNASAVSANAALVSAISAQSNSSAALSAALSAAQAHQRDILARIDNTAAPQTSAPGQSGNALWESIIGPQWQEHLARYGVGWNTGLTLGSERAANMASMVAKYDTQLSAKNAPVYAAASATAASDQGVANSAYANNANAIAALAAADNAAKKAALDYANAMQNFVIDASKSVGKLTKLREETVKYYEAQKALADLMATSAAGLRSSVETYRYNQKTPEQQVAELQAKFGTAYSTALSVQGDGTALAGQGDKLNAMLQPLIDKLTETGKGNLIDSYLAQAESVAKLLEQNAPVNYQADSLNMLGSIDATLAALDASSQSAEKIISDAVKAGSDKTAAGLHGVIAALTGQAIPAFASGGTFTGGLRIVGENGPELEATGPSRIFNANQTRAMLSGGGNTARLEALVEIQGKQLEAMSYELRAIAGSTNKSARLLDRAMPDGDALATRATA